VQPQHSLSCQGSSAPLVYWLIFLLTSIHLLVTTYVHKRVDLLVMTSSKRPFVVYACQRCTLQAAAPIHRPTACLTLRFTPCERPCLQRPHAHLHRSAPHDQGRVGGQLPGAPPLAATLHGHLRCGKRRVLLCGLALRSCSVVLLCGLALWACSAVLLCGLALQSCSAGLLCGLALRSCSAGLLCGLALRACSAGLLC